MYQYNKRKEHKMRKKSATTSDKLFAETKLRMVMRLNNMTREQAAADIEKRRLMSQNPSKCDSDKEIMSAEEFFGEI